MLRPHNLLTPYWDYRIEQTLIDPRGSSLWKDNYLNKVHQAKDAEWLFQFIQDDINEEKNEFFDNDSDIVLWRRRSEAVKKMREVKNMDVFWHLLLLISIETGIDQTEGMFTHKTCSEYRLTSWNGSYCKPLISEGFRCLTDSECTTQNCVYKLCKTRQKETTTTTTKLPMISTTETPLTSTTLIPNIVHTNFAWLTTEFLAKELDPSTAIKVKSYDNLPKKKNRKKKGKKRPKTTPTPTEQTFEYQIPPTTLQTEPTLPSYMNSTTLNETNAPIEPEKYGGDTLDALLVYMPTPKVPAGMIPWTNRMPLKMAYFTFTIIEGGLDKNKKLKEKGVKRAKGARIYVKGLDMPSGYKQVTQVKCLP